MGQKVNIKGFRLGVTEYWNSSWYGNNITYSKSLYNDYQIKLYIICVSKKLKIYVENCQIKQLSKNIYIYLSLYKAFIRIRKNKRKIYKFKYNKWKLKSKLRFFKFKRYLKFRKNLLKYKYKKLLFFYKKGLINNISLDSLNKKKDLTSFENKIIFNLNRSNWFKRIKKYNYRMRLKKKRKSRARIFYRLFLYKDLLKNNVSFKKSIYFSNNLYKYYNNNLKINNKFFKNNLNKSLDLKKNRIKLLIKYFKIIKVFKSTGYKVFAKQYNKNLSTCKYNYKLLLNNLLKKKRSKFTIKNLIIRLKKLTKYKIYITVLKLNKFFLMRPYNIRYYEVINKFVNFKKYRYFYNTIYIVDVSLFLRNSQFLVDYLSIQFSRFRIKYVYYVSFITEVLRYYKKERYKGILKGLRLRISGKVKGRKKNMADYILIQIGRLGILTLNSVVKYAFSFSATRYGVLGIKLWLTYYTLNYINIKNRLLYLKKSKINSENISKNRNSNFNKKNGKIYKK